MVRDMTALQEYGDAISAIKDALPEHRYHHVEHNRSHGSASAYGHLRIHHNRLYKAVQEYITGYGIVPSLSSILVLEEYRLLKEAIQEYSNSLREDKRDAISQYLCLVDNAECKHHDLELEV